MAGYLALVLHAHLPFVRQPAHERFLEESWLYEAITETYLPLIGLLERWQHDGIRAPLTLSLSPTLCAMLQDPLLRKRFVQRLAALTHLAECEVVRNHWDAERGKIAEFYVQRLTELRDIWERWDGDLVTAFGAFRRRGGLELITCAATHPVLPLLADHPPSLRAQLLTAADSFRRWFEHQTMGMWLPECAYMPEVESALQEAGCRWFICDTHGFLAASPRPVCGTYAPLLTPRGLAVFGRDLASARQVWSRDEGYPGDPAYRDFYRDIGYDLDFDYVRPYLPAPDHRGFTGIKYHRITGPQAAKGLYDRDAATARAREHARHFLSSRRSQCALPAPHMDRPPLVVAPYDAELFGHWWYEGPDFLDALVRETARPATGMELVTPSQYLLRHPTHQIAELSASSWGEEGYWKVWLNERNAWILPHVRLAAERMTELARAFPAAEGLTRRALMQAGREVLLAQASDWPFILHHASSPDYARRCVQEHVVRFLAIHEQLTSTRVDEPWLATIEQLDLIFPALDYRLWA